MPTNSAIHRLEPSHRLAPRLWAGIVEDVEAGSPKLVSRVLHCGCVRDLELDADLRNEAIHRPLVCSEAGLRRLAEGPYAEVLAAPDLLAVEIIVTSGGVERKSQRVDEQLATPLDVVRDDAHACDELDVHTDIVSPPSPQAPSVAPVPVVDDVLPFGRWHTGGEQPRRTSAGWLSTCEGQVGDAAR
jgi:hypothetical protein